MMSLSCEQTLILTDERLDRATVEFPVHFCLCHVVALAVVALSHVAAIWTCDNNNASYSDNLHNPIIRLTYV